MHVSRPQISCRTQAQEQVDLQPAAESELAGEDAATFDLSKQSLTSWGVFGVLLTTVLGAMYMVRALQGVQGGSSTYNEQQQQQEKGQPIISKAPGSNQKLGMGAQFNERQLAMHWLQHRLVPGAARLAEHRPSPDLHQL